MSVVELFVICFEVELCVLFSNVRETEWPPIGKKQLIRPTIYFLRISTNSRLIFPTSVFFGIEISV